jgi:hypothetical protein
MHPNKEWVFIDPGYRKNLGINKLTSSSRIRSDDEALHLASSEGCLLRKGKEMNAHHTAEEQ